METGVPLWRTSAEPFEGQYAIVRRCYKSGTRNLPLQVLQNTFTRVKHVSFYGKKKKMLVHKATKSKRIANDLILLKDDSFAQVMNDTTPYHAHPILTSVYQPDLGFRLPWHVTLLHTYRGVDTMTMRIVNEDEIVGKALLCGNVLSGNYQEWFMSKKDC